MGLNQQLFERQDVLLTISSQNLNATFSMFLFWSMIPTWANSCQSEMKALKNKTFLDSQDQHALCTGLVNISDQSIN